AVRSNSVEIAHAAAAESGAAMLGFIETEIDARPRHGKQSRTGRGNLRSAAAAESETERAEDFVAAASDFGNDPAVSIERQSDDGAGRNAHRISAFAHSTAARDRTRGGVAKSFSECDAASVPRIARARYFGNAGAIAIAGSVEEHSAGDAANARRSSRGRARRRFRDAVLAQSERGRESFPIERRADCKSGNAGAGRQDRQGKDRQRRSADDRREGSGFAREWTRRRGRVR